MAFNSIKVWDPVYVPINIHAVGTNLYTAVQQMKWNEMKTCSDVGF